MLKNVKNEKDKILMFNFVTFYYRHFDWSEAEWRNLMQ